MRIALTLGRSLIAIMTVGAPRATASVKAIARNATKIP
jgi:hypothetical protein